MANSNKDNKTRMPDSNELKWNVKKSCIEMRLNPKLYDELEY